MREERGNGDVNKLNSVISGTKWSKSLIMPRRCSDRSQSSADTEDAVEGLNLFLPVKLPRSR